MNAAPLAKEMKQIISSDLISLKRERDITPKLVALLIGDDPVSKTYVDLKRRDCAEVGITSEVIDFTDLDRKESSSTIIESIRKLNDDQEVHGIIPQMPFNGKVSEELVFSTLSPLKDVDGLTPFRLGKLIRTEYDLNKGLIPCTPKGIILLCLYYKVPIQGMDVAIVGRGSLVGEPLRKLFQDLNATSVCYHTKTKDLFSKLRSADIVVAASGRPPEIFGPSGLRISSEMVKDGSTVISVGTRKDPASGKMLFDVDPASLIGKCSFLSPNTGGVGLMTRISLLQNTVNACRMQIS